MAAIAKRIRKLRQRDARAADPTPVELSSEAVEAVLDKRARKALHMSGAEFVERLRKGDLPDNAAVDELAVLVGGRG